MNDEVSVAELLVREGWGERKPPDARSRWRVVAVMLAVVIGCGTAAVLVAFSGSPRQDAEQVDQIRVIPMPDRSTGLGGADQATDSPSEGGVGGGTGDSPQDGSHPVTVQTVAHSEAVTTEASTPVTSATAETSPRDDPTSVPTSTTTSAPPSHQPAPPTTSETCVLWVLFCH